MTKNIDASFSTIIKDASGNYLVARVVINQTFEMIVVNMYELNTDAPDFFETVENYCLELAGEDTIILIVGDLNVVLDSED